MVQAMAMLGALSAGLFAGGTGKKLLWLLPALALGGWLGVRLYRGATAERFRLLLMVLLLVSGIPWCCKREEASMTFVSKPNVEPLRN